MIPMRAAALTVSCLAFALAPAIAQDSIPKADTAQVTSPGKDAKWDVETSLGFDRELNFETREGTWMNLDVSPDGQRIAFEILGDIYDVPITGGAARLLSSGPAFEQQPRYSPDGRSIAFISDRGGADNIWLMRADGSNRRQLTTEKDFYPTNADWMPDGDYIVTKRHVVDTRSAGGGELWLYHVDGGDGVRLVEKRGFTSELNEPAPSADGEWVYYTAAGPFDYNRDPHAGIFQITRYNRLTGRSEPVTRDAGGGIRPTPSPDGKQLAFIRRVGTNTVLFVRNLETGAERPVFDRLDHDQMETWVIHGAYPTFSWLPDSRNIVIPFGGKINTIDTRTGAAREIPFVAQVSQKLTETVHFEQDPGTGPVRARVIRWPSFTPDGGRVVFQALGRIWQMNVPGGSPARVTSGERLEFAPAISPDGRWVAFTTWNSDDGGALWKAPLRAGDRTNPVRLAAAADQFANPTWSPDGSRIAFIQGSGQTSRGADLSDEWFLRIKTVGANGGAVRDVTTTANRGASRRMPALTWGGEGERLYYFESADSKTVLTSVQLDGTDKRQHATNDIAEEIIVSPDGRYVAFKDLHNVYVAPLPRVGDEPVTLSRSGSPMPVKQLSRWGGDWLAWSPDSRHVTWTLGPEIVRQSLAEIYPEPTPADSAKKDDADAPKTNLLVKGDAFEVVLNAPRARPDGVVALTNARIITMRGDEVIENGTIVIEDDRIRAVGATGSVDVPADARVVDAAGKTVIPGLIDVHAHMGYMALDVNPDRPWQYFANLAYGVTTTHDPSASTQMVFSESELVETGQVLGPRVFSTGYILYGARNPARVNVNTLDDARAALKRLKALGAFSVKSYNQRRRDSRQMIIQAAREEKMHVYPEGGSMLQQNLSMFTDGHTGIEHAIPVAELYGDAIRLAAESGTGYTPTLIVGYGGVWGENYWYQHDDVFRNQRLLQFTPRGVLDARARRRMLVPEEEFYHFELAKTAKRILDAGGQIQLGAHGQIQGIGVHWELWMFEQGGMTPLEALRTATLAGATYLGFGNHLGSLEPGKLADLVVLDANPLENIRNSERVNMVMKNGFLYDASLNQVWPTAKPAPRLPLTGVNAGMLQAER